VHEQSSEVLNQRWLIEKLR